MQFSLTTVILGLAALAAAVPHHAGRTSDTGAAAAAGGATTQGAPASFGGNGNRGNPVGACCTPNTSLKEDDCTDASGAAGKCVPAGTANCGGALTCIANNLLTCDNNTLENGRPTCRLP